MQGPLSWSTRPEDLGAEHNQQRRQQPPRAKHQSAATLIASPYHNRNPQRPYNLAVPPSISTYLILISSRSPPRCKRTLPNPSNGRQPLFRDQRQSRKLAIDEF